MDTHIPAELVGWDQVIRDRQAALRSDATDARLARVAREGRSASRSVPRELWIAMRRSAAGVNVMGDLFR